MLRDDLRLADALRLAAHEPVTGGPFAVPVLAVAGADDPVALPRAMPGWAAGPRGRWSAAPSPGTTSSTRGTRCRGCSAGPAALCTASRLRGLAAPLQEGSTRTRRPAGPGSSPVRVHRSSGPALGSGSTVS
ncbi:hypothetical protein ACFQVA_42080 [Actinomadura keratinilytica]